jgi:predicted dehydrogenase
LISAVHGHRWGRRHQASELKVEGTRGAAVATMGVNLDYPKGEPDTLEVCLDGVEGGGWERVKLRGSWFGEAFEGPISNLLRFTAGEDAVLVTGVEDAVKTMGVVERCYGGR